MLLTVSQGITTTILVAIAAAGGWFWGKTTVNLNQDMVKWDESAPIIAINNQYISLADLDSVSRMEIARMSSEVVLKAQNLALRQAALRQFAMERSQPENWRKVLTEQLSEQNLRRIYSEFPSFSQTGDFENVFSEVERYVIEIERNKLVGSFMHENSEEKKITLVDHQVLSVQIPFSLEGWPLIYVGNERNPKSRELQVLFRYAGQLSNSAFSLIEKIAQDNQLLIPVRLIPEKTNSSYDNAAISELFDALLNKSSLELAQTHVKLLKNSPALSDLSNLNVVKEQISKITAPQKPLSLRDTSIESRLDTAASWYRDIRTSKIPIFFVDKNLVSETHPRGFAFALINSLSRRSVGRSDD